ncbi:MAG: hypothetical protein ACRDQA_27130, partial [Nocardioidaceae bacterium]
STLRHRPRGPSTHDSGPPWIATPSMSGVLIPFLLPAYPGAFPTFPATSRVRSLTPELSKGLEFDLVVLIDPEAFGEGIEGAVDRYVAMTRATQQLVILTSSAHSAAFRGRSPTSYSPASDSTSFQDHSARSS